jgi:hypothetical protein
MSRSLRVIAVLLLVATAGCVGTPGEPTSAIAPAQEVTPELARKVDALFANELHRAPTPDEQRFWSGELATRGEAQVRSYARLVAESIGEVYHRPPTAAELARFTQLLDRGVPL